MGCCGFIGDLIEDALEWVKDNIIKPFFNWIKKTARHLVNFVVKGIKGIAKWFVSIFDNRFVKSVMRFLVKAIAVATLAYLFFYATSYLFAYSSFSSFTDFAFKQALRLGFNEILKEIFPTPQIPEYLKSDIAEQIQYAIYSIGDVYHFLPGGFMFNETEAGGLFFGYNTKLDKYAYIYGYPDNTDKSMLINFVSPFENLPGGELYNINMHF